MKSCSSCQRCYDDAVVCCAEVGHPKLSNVREGTTEVIAGYRLEILLRTGLKDQTYRARRLDSDQPCLIKLVSTNEEYKQLFLRDAKTATTLFNQSVVDIYEADSLENGDVFVVAEEPAGQTVRELLNNVGVPQLLTTIQVVRQAAEAVHALHLSGLIHRAICPENIILTTDAEHRLLVRIQNPDLGGVVEHSIVSNKFLIDAALDSLRYFAPEQFSGGTTIKTDVYGLGIILYEMLSGAPPFDSDKASGLIDMHRNQRPPDITIDNFDLRMLLIHTLMESLQKAPEKRQSSANAFARQLRHMEQLALHSPTPPPASVAPTVPTMTNGTAGTATAARLAPAIEPPQATRGIAEQQIVLKTEPKTHLRQVPENASQPKTKPVPSTIVLGEIELIPAAKFEVSTQRTDEVSELVTEQLIETTKAVRESAPKSRLKRLKKQLHTYTTPMSLTPPSELSVPQNGEIVQNDSNGQPKDVPFGKVNSEHPEDDFPFYDGIPEPKEPLETEFTQPPIVEVRIVPTAAAIVRKAESEPLEEDLPSLDEIPEALFAEPMPVTAIVAVSPIVIPLQDVSQKIESEQPEDDIPSLPVGSEPSLIEAVAAKQVLLDAPMLFAPVPVALGKIEWEQPEDEIHSVEDCSNNPLAEPISTEAIVPEPESSITATPVAAVPPNLEWEQPDDIPSMEDAFYALSEERVIEDATRQMATEEIAPAELVSTPRKIEWEQPDDIPSVEEVDPVLSNELAIEVASIPEAIKEVAPAPAPVTTPRKIEWEQPDDIPSVEEVDPVLSKDLAIEAASMQGGIEEVAPAAISTPRKIEWEQPEDIPSMEDALHAFSEPVAVSNFVEPQIVEAALASPTGVPRKIEWDQPEDDIPSVEEVMEVRAAETFTPLTLSELDVEPEPVPDVPPAPIPDVNFVSDIAPVRAEIKVPDEIINAETVGQSARVELGFQPEPVAIQPASVVAAIEQGPEEITLVSPPRRITVEWDQPPSWEPGEHISKEIEFFPTLLGEANNRRNTGHNETFFSDYDEEPSPSSDHYRSLMIGSGFITLITLFLFGNDSFRNFFQTETPTDSASVQTSAKQPLAQPEQRVDLPPLPTTVGKPGSSDDVYPSQTRSSAMKANSPTADKGSDKSSATTGKPEKQTQPPAPDRNVSKPALVPSTLVISSDSGKISSKVEPQNRSGERKSRPGQNTPSGSIRPRIVDSPRK